jgi:hypothetical protein
VARIGDKSASVGNEFEFKEKKPVEELKKQFMIELIDPKTNTKSKVTNFTPADYEKEITYRTGAELAKLVASGGTTSPPEAATQGAQVDYSKQL